MPRVLPPSSLSVYTIYKGDPYRAISSPPTPPKLRVSALGLSRHATYRCVRLLDTSQSAHSCARFLVGIIVGAHLDPTERRKSEREILSLVRKKERTEIPSQDMIKINSYGFLGGASIKIPTNRFLLNARINAAKACFPFLSVSLSLSLTERNAQ